MPVEVEKNWKSFLNFLKNLNDISFDRYLFADQNNFVSIELHGYCDASKTAYSAVLEKLLRYLYVDDLATCFDNGKLAFSFYENSKKILALGGFDLCKWFTNSRQLREKIFETENDRPIDVKTTKKILGVNWDLDNDKFVFKFDEIVSFASTLTCSLIR